MARTSLHGASPSETTIATEVDLFTTTFSDDYKTLYRNDGGGVLSRCQLRSDWPRPDSFLIVGTAFIDFDNDGLLDLFIANGHVYPQVDLQDWGTTGRSARSYSTISTARNFQEVPPATGSGFGGCNAGRGAAFGDLFNDGHIDVVLTISIPSQRFCATSSIVAITG